MVKEGRDIIKTVVIHDFEPRQSGVFPKGEKPITPNHLHPGVDNSRQRRKSPVTVQEWVAALPIPHTVQRGLALETQQQKERKNIKTLRTSDDEDDEEEDDDEINEILKEDESIHSKKSFKSRQSSIGVVSARCQETSDNEDDNLVLGAEAASGNNIFYPFNKDDLAQKRKCRNSLDSRRRYLKESRELYRSFQSDISIKTVSSVDSVLLARELNPTDMLMELGFGGPPTSNLARIPRRFLKDSDVKGISLRNFISMQDEVLEYGGGMDNVSYPSMDESCSYNVKSKSEIVDTFLEHLFNPSSRQSLMLSRWSSSCSLSRIPPSYTTNSIISSSQTSKPAASLRGVQAFRAAAQSVLSPANRQFLSEKPKPSKAKKLILGDETLTVNEDGDIKHPEKATLLRSLSVGSLDSDWSGDDEELKELKRVAQSSSEKNKAILRWKKIRKAAVQRKKDAEKEKSDDARLIFPLEKCEEDTSNSSASIESEEDENDEARSLPCFGERNSSFHHHHHHNHIHQLQSLISHRSPMKQQRLSTSSEPQVLNYILNAIQRDHRIPKRFSFNSTAFTKYCS